jgi:hypothetical protein
MHFRSFAKIFFSQFLNTFLCLETNSGLLRVEVVCKIEKYFYDVCKLDKLITSEIHKHFKLPNSNSNSRDNNQTTPNLEKSSDVARNRSKDDTTATRGGGRTNRDSSNDSSTLPSTTDRDGPAEKDRNGTAEKIRNGPAEKIRNGPAEKVRNGPAEKDRNGPAEKIRNGPAEKEGAGGADLDSSKRLSGQGMPRQTQYRTPRARKNFGIRAVSTPQVLYLNLF